jgi:hypothetical protein
MIQPHTVVPPHQPMTLSTNPFSSLPTSFLNASTSFQQSSGRRSFSLRHLTTSPFAFSIASSTIPSFGRESNLLRREVMDSWTVLLVGVDCSVWVSSEGDGGSSDEICSSSSFSRRDSRSRSLSSSEATRDCMWSSSVFSRVESVCVYGVPCQQWINKHTCGGRRSGDMLTSGLLWRDPISS